MRRKSETTYTLVKQFNADKHTTQNEIPVFAVRCIELEKENNICRYTAATRVSFPRSSTPSGVPSSPRIRVQALTKCLA